MVKVTTCNKRLKLYLGIFSISLGINIALLSGIINNKEEQKEFVNIETIYSHDSAIKTNQDMGYEEATSSTWGAVDLKDVEEIEEPEVEVSLSSEGLSFGYGLINMLYCDMGTEWLSNLHVSEECVKRVEEYQAMLRNMDNNKFCVSDAYDIEVQNNMDELIRTGSVVEKNGSYYFNTTVGESKVDTGTQEEIFEFEGKNYILVNDLEFVKGDNGEYATIMYKGFYFDIPKSSVSRTYKMRIANPIAYTVTDKYTKGDELICDFKNEYGNVIKVSVKFKNNLIDSFELGETNK